MQPGDVARIDAALHRLQPIAFLEALGDEALLGLHRREFPFRQWRLMLGRSHIGPQHAAALDQRIGAELDLARKAALLRLGGNLDALAAHIELPAMVRTADAAFLVAAEPQR